MVSLIGAEGKVRPFMRDYRVFGAEPQLGFIVFLVSLPMLYLLGALTLGFGTQVFTDLWEYSTHPADGPLGVLWLCYFARMLAMYVARRRLAKRIGVAVEDVAAVNGHSSNWLWSIATGILLALLMFRIDNSDPAGTATNVAAFVAIGLTALHCALILAQPDELVFEESSEELEVA